jgi:Ca2+-binding EF-hand superfamily protein
MTTIGSLSGGLQVLSSYNVAADTNGDGVVSAEELAASQSGRSQDPTVTGDSAAAGAASQVASSVVSMMLDAQAAGASRPPEPMDAASLFSTIDADGDGNVTREEFLSARPSDMSEEQAAQLFDQFDTEGTGTLSQDQFVEAFEANRPDGPPPPPSETASTSDELDVEDILDEVQRIIDAYRLGLDETETETAVSTSSTSDSTTV